MSVDAEIDGVDFWFSDGRLLLKYDDSVFHRNQFQSFAGGSKTVDLVAVSSDGVVWLVEVKDYRRHRHAKPGSIYEEMAMKARATLAGLAVAQIRATDADEKNFALRIRVVLHPDQAASPSRLFPQVFDPASTQLQRLLRPVAPPPRQDH